MTCLTIIVAATKNNGIGKNSQLPWRLSKELKYFAQVTSNAPEGQQNAVIMGRRTWESIPPRFRPLPKRLNIVVSRNPEYKLSTTSDAAAALVGSLESAVSYIDSKSVHRAFLIGGASLYSESLSFSSVGSSAFVDRVLLTRILEPEFDCDVFMPDFLKEGENWKRAKHDVLNRWVGFEVPEGVQEENGVKYEFQMWTRDGNN